MEYLVIFSYENMRHNSKVILSYTQYKYYDVQYGKI